MTLGSAGSMARARAGKPSVTRFIQRICKGLKGTPPKPIRGAAAMIKTSPILLPKIYLTKRRILS